MGFELLPDPEWVHEYAVQEDSPILSRLRSVLARKQSVAPPREQVPPVGSAPAQRASSDISSASDQEPVSEWCTDSTKSLRWRGPTLLQVRGMRVVAPYSFEEDIIDACWAHLPDLPALPGGPLDTPQDSKSRPSLCVLFRHSLFILPPIWGFDPIQVPFAFDAADMWPAEQGVFITRLPEAEDYSLPFSGNDAPDRLPTLFYFSRPLQELQPVYTTARIYHRLPSRSDEPHGTPSPEATILYQEPLKVFATFDESPVGAVAYEDARILVTRSKEMGMVNVYSYSVGSSDAQPLPSNTSTLGCETPAFPRGRPSIPSTMSKGRLSTALGTEGDALDRTRRASWMTPAPASAAPLDEEPDAAVGISSRRASLRPRNPSGMARTASGMGRTPSAIGRTPSAMGRTPSTMARTSSGMSRTPSVAMGRTASASSLTGAAPKTLGSDGDEVVINHPNDSPSDPWDDLDRLEPGHALVCLLDHISAPADLDLDVRLVPPIRDSGEATLVLTLGGREEARALRWSPTSTAPDEGKQLRLVRTHVPLSTDSEPRCPLTSAALSALGEVLDTSGLRATMAAAFDTPSAGSIGEALDLNGFVSHEWEAFCCACFGNVTPPPPVSASSYTRSRPDLTPSHSVLLARIERANNRLELPLSALDRATASDTDSITPPFAPAPATSVMPTPEDARALAALHLLAQELMMDMRHRQTSVEPLAKLLVQLANQCGAQPLSDYWLAHLGESSSGAPSSSTSAPHLNWLDYLVSRKHKVGGDAFFSFCHGLGLERDASDALRNTLWRLSWTAELDEQHKILSSSNEEGAYHAWLARCSEQLDRLASKNVTVTDIIRLIPAVNLGPVLQAIHDFPWLLQSSGALELVGRMDCAAQLAEGDAFRKQDEAGLVFYESDIRTLPTFSTDSSIFLPPVCGQLFPHDFRLQEACRMLDTSKPQFVRFGPKHTEEDTLRHVHGGLCRIQATTVGRGMLTLRSKPWIPTRSWPTPPLVLEVRVNQQKWTTPAFKDAEDMEWVEFHNGVASALSMVSDNRGGIDSHWLFRMQGREPNATHAGFLLGVGLLGQLGGLGRVHAWRYLVHQHALTSVGVILGLAATFVGTQDRTAFTLTSIQLPSFLPPDSAPLNTLFVTQAAGLLSVGLLFMASDQRSQVEVLLHDLVPPEPESPDLQSDYREGHALAAGFALGLVLLGRASREPVQSQADWRIIQTLQDLMDGSPCEELSHARRAGHPANGVENVGLRTTDRLHRMGVSSAPATIALAFIFLRSGRVDVANRIGLPNSAAQMDEIRPDLLFARVLARALIMWDDIRDEAEWLQSSLPPCMQSYVLPEQLLPDGELDPTEEAVQLAYINMRMGAAFAMGLKFAGTGRMSAAEAVLTQELERFKRAASQQLGGYFSKIRYNLLQAALDVVGLALAMVLVGTGDVALMRFLRERHHSLNLTYGNQMATHMALGFLFLGGGRFTLARTDQAIASLVISLWPRFPASRTDNRAHLQAFRHLWVLALDHRLALARDVDSGHSEAIPIRADRPKEGAPVTEAALAQAVARDMLSEGHWESKIQTPAPTPLRPQSVSRTTDWTSSEGAIDPFAILVSPSPLPPVKEEYKLHSSTPRFWPARVLVPGLRGTSPPSHPLRAGKLDPTLLHLKRTVQVEWALECGEVIVRPISDSVGELTNKLATAVSFRSTQPESKGRYTLISSADPGARAWLLGLLNPSTSDEDAAKSAAGVYQMVANAAATGGEARLAASLLLAHTCLYARLCSRLGAKRSWSQAAIWGAKDAALASSLSFPLSLAEPSPLLAQVVQAAQEAGLLPHHGLVDSADALQALVAAGLPVDGSSGTALSVDEKQQAAQLVAALAEAQTKGL